MTRRPLLLTLLTPRPGTRSLRRVRRPLAKSAAALRRLPC